MARDLSVQAILSARTTPFEQGMKSAANAAKKFSADMKKVRQEINQPLYVPRPGQKEGLGMVMLGGSVGDALNAQIRKTYQDRFEIIRNGEMRALRLRQFHVRKEEEVERLRAERMSRFTRLGKRALGGAGIGALAGLFGGGDSSNPLSAGVSILGGAASGSFVGGAPGAVIGGTIAALIELQQELKRTANFTKEFSEAMRLAGQQFSRGENQKTLDLFADFRQTQRQLFGRDAAPGEETPMLGGIFGMVGGGRFERQKLFQRGLAQSAHAQEKIDQELSPEFTRAAIRRMTAELVEQERQKRGGHLTSWFGFQDDSQDVIDRARIEATRRVTARNQRLVRDRAHLAQEQASLRFRQFRERGVGIGADVISGFGNALGNFNLGALVPNAIRDPAMRAAQQASALWVQTQRNIAENQTIAERVLSLRGQMEGQRNFAPLAMRGTNEYLQAIHDQPKAEKSLADLVKIAKEQLAEEKKLANEIGQEINRQRVTVKM